MMKGVFSVYRMYVMNTIGEIHSKKRVLFPLLVYWLYSDYVLGLLWGKQNEGR